MISDGLFLCGCNPATKQYYRQTIQGNSLSYVIKDSEGFVVCPDHGERMYGWRSKFQRSEGKIIFNPYAVPDLRDNRDPEKIGAEILANTNGKP